MGKKKKGGGGGGKNKQKKGAGGGSVESRKNSPAVVRKKGSNGPFPASGLMNLGNTCFFNSVMQSIGQTEYLRHRLDTLVDGIEQQTLCLTAEQQQLEVVLSGKPGQLTKTLHTFMKEIATPTTGRALNPRPLFSQICEKAPRFRSYQQQDSQELLRYLLDSLKMEEIHRVKQGILESFKVSSGKKEALSHLSQKDKDAIKKFGSMVYGVQTYVDEVFGGVLVSTITCRECHNSSTIHENYLDLSLPVPRDESGRREEGKQWFKGNKRDKTQKPSEPRCEGVLQREVEMGVKGGEEIAEESKGAALSKHQIKKAKKKTRKGGKVKQSFQDLHNVLNEADGKRKLSDTTNDEGEERGNEGDQRVEGEGGDVGGGGDEGGRGGGEEVGGEGGGEEVKSDARRTTENEAENAEIIENGGGGDEGGRGGGEEVGGEGGGEEVKSDARRTTENEAENAEIIENGGGGDEGGRGGGEEVGGEGGGEEVKSDAQRTTENEAENGGADIQSETPAAAAAEEQEEAQNEACSNPETTPISPIETSTVPEAEVDQHSDERVEPTHADEELPADDVVAVETADDALPRQPEATPPPLHKDASQTTDNASPMQTETTPPLNKATPTRNRPLTSEQFKEDSLEGCLRKFCSVEILSGVNQFYCDVCTQQRARDRAAANATSETNRENQLQQVSESQVGDSERWSEALKPEHVEGSGTVCESTEEDNIRTKFQDGDIRELADSEPEVARRQVKNSPESSEDCQTATMCGHSQATVSDVATNTSEGGNDDGGLCNGYSLESVIDEEKKSAAVADEVGEEEEGKEEERNEERYEKEEEGEGEGMGGDRQEGDSGEEKDGSEDNNSRSSSRCESTKEPDSEEDSMAELTPEKKKPTSDKTPEEPVLRDAMKQLLIKTLPPIFTLHMKRFLQDGRRLRKNGRHIDFPDILDVAPFCISDCEAPRDDEGRSLYSLYAVVEHAGGMQGGHYTAYIRIRPSHAHYTSHTHFTTNGGASNPVSPTQHEYRKMGVASPATGTATSGSSTANSTTDDQRSAIGTTTKINHTQQTQDHNTVNCDPNNYHTHEATSEQSQTTENHTETTSGTKTEPNWTNHNFDLSSTGGQWYHISDTHVRTATQTEVHKCQAYLLFYERLPLQQ